MEDLVLREYQARDIPRMLDILCDAIPRLPNYRKLTLKRYRLEYLLTHNIDNAAGFAAWVLCDSHDQVQGGGAGWCVMSLMSEDMVADDVFLYVLPEYRSLRHVNMLFSAYKEWAIARKATLIRASHTGGSFREGSKEQRLFDILLERNGFKPVGRVFHYQEE